MQAAAESDVQHLTTLVEKLQKDMKEAQEEALSAREAEASLRHTVQVRPPCDSSSRHYTSQYLAHITAAWGMWVHGGSVMLLKAAGVLIML